ncbi:hypothetical protein GALL_489770 [mine drainage metagenome]|uniref:Uncharacterized protein n=1 Tax=mine drainage metagenome TaxID=410659 RepID=A0A1J5PCR3_9ZZZZ
MVGQMAQRTEDALVVGVVGAKLHAEALGDNQSNFEDVDGVQPQTLAIERLVRIDIDRIDFEPERCHDDLRDVANEAGIG